MANSTVKILGATLDATMSLDKQITNTVRWLKMQLRKISTIQRYLSDSAVKTLVQSAVISRLKQLKRLHLSHNNAARLIYHLHFTVITSPQFWINYISCKRC